MKINVWLQWIVLMLCLIIVAAKDYYQILGVKRDASDKEIKRKFRKLGKIATSSSISFTNSYSLSSIEISSR